MGSHGLVGDLRNRQLQGYRVCKVELPQASWFSLSMKSVSAHRVAVRDVLVYLCGG